MTSTRDFETAQPEEVIVATQLCSCQGAGGERGIIVGGKRIIFGGKCVSMDARYLPEASVSRPGIDYGHDPSWNFTGNRRGANDPVTVTDRSPEIAGANG